MDTATLFTLVGFGLSIVTGALLLVVAVEFGYAGRVLADVLIGAVIAVFLMLAYPPPPMSPDWIRLLIWAMASALSHFAPRFLTPSAKEPPVAASHSIPMQHFASETEALEELFDFEEVTEWDE